jgi:phage virion morphogenesis protein
VTVRGDFVRLRKLSQALRKASKSAHRDTCKVFAAALERRTMLCFQQGQSPYGEAWAPVRRRRRRAEGSAPQQPLLDTGRLRNSLHARPSGSGVSISSNVEYAGIHNYGGTIQRKGRVQPRQAKGVGGRFISRREAAKAANATKRRQRLGVAKTRVAFLPGGANVVPKRQFLPDEARGLPPKYVADLQATAEAVQQALGLGGL